MEKNGGRKMEMRLQKFLAEAGVASRRKAEELIVMGKVQVNGKVITELGKKVEKKKDIVFYENKKVQLKNFIYIFFQLVYFFYNIFFRCFFFCM